ncbi:DUF6470 family protein [Pseudogracilibacillus sp. ICA-222130]|uniref:DUF6470 family protein n=1 Tax=Pseudogracilibacillus sp. ICA-222130 TaxID=3134655 RepID=UPI0030BCA37D
MNIPQIRMESQFAKIAWRQTNAHVEIEQPNAIVSIEQPKAHVAIETRKGKLTIDQSKAWEQMNMYGPIRAVEKTAEEGKRAIQEGIVRRAEQGAQLINIHDEVNYIAELAKENGQRPMKQLNIGFIPQPFSVNIQYEKATVDVQIEPNKPIISVQIRKPEITYHPGNIEIFMEEDASLHIDYTNLYEDET